MSPGVGDLVGVEADSYGFRDDPDVDRGAPSVPVPRCPGVVLVSRSRWDGGLPLSQVLWGDVTLWVPTVWLVPHT